jgi:hypothetical protein
MTIIRSATVLNQYDPDTPQYQIAQRASGLMQVLTDYSQGNLVSDQNPSNPPQANDWTPMIFENQFSSGKNNALKFKRFSANIASGRVAIRANIAGTFVGSGTLDPFLQFVKWDDSAGAFAALDGGATNGKVFPTALRVAPDEYIYDFEDTVDDANDYYELWARNNDFSDLYSVNLLVGSFIQIEVLE